MKRRLLDILVCCKCHGNLELVDPVESESDIEAGTLRCSSCSESFEIYNGIPRFVPKENYASSFGYQWNVFRTEQIDSDNQTSLSADRFFSETEWTPEWLKDKVILDVGCGAGRFLDAAAPTGAHLVGVDITTAVDAAKISMEEKNYDNVDLVQASIYELPFRKGTFDGLYCIGVIQHTPDPFASIRALPEFLKHKGKICLTIYLKKPYTFLYGKYLVRPITKRLPKGVLLFLLKITMPILFPLTEVLFRIPILSKFFKFIIPVTNYVEKKQLTFKQRYEWALLDTFDMLSPAFDRPMTPTEVKTTMEEAGVEQVKRLPNTGVNMVGLRP